jgi:DNA-binding response OmpR family regulator
MRPAFSISNLRKKLPKGFIRNIRGVGYTVGDRAA